MFTDTLYMFLVSVLPLEDKLQLSGLIIISDPLPPDLKLVVAGGPILAEGTVKV